MHYLEISIMIVMSREEIYKTLYNSMSIHTSKFTQNKHISNNLWLKRYEERSTN